jgi:hypothetical protein
MMQFYRIGLQIEAKNAAQFYCGEAFQQKHAS